MFDEIFPSYIRNIFTASQFYEKKLLKKLFFFLSFLISNQSVNEATCRRHVQRVVRLIL